MEKRSGYDVTLDLTHDKLSTFSEYLLIIEGSIYVLLFHSNTNAVQVTKLDFVFESLFWETIASQDREVLSINNTKA